MLLSDNAAMFRTASLIALVLLTGCFSTRQDPAITPLPAASMGEAPLYSQAVTLEIGASTMLDDGSRLTYLRLVNDSRCPPGVQCAWAGDAGIAVRWQSARGGRAQDAMLHTHPLQDARAEAVFGAYRVRLQALERGIAPKATLHIERD